MRYFVNDKEVTKDNFYIKLHEFKLHAKNVFNYVEKVKNGEINIDEVPQEYYEEVYSIINTPEPEPDATIEDYETALSELGVNVNEEV